MDRGPGPSFAALCFATTGTAQALGPAGTTPVGVVAARILVGGRLPAPVHEALERLQAACAGADPPWSEINEAHADLHAALVRDLESHGPQVLREHLRSAAETLV
jgi:hypothetical protein